MSEAVIAEINSWLIKQGLEGDSLIALTDGFGRQVAAAGLPVARAYLALPSIHPTLSSESVTWLRGRPAFHEGTKHGEGEDAWEASPINFMLQKGIERFRWDLADPEAIAGFPLLAEMRDEGYSEYVAHIVGFAGGPTTALQGVGLTACSDRPGGFRPEDIAFLNALVPSFALAAYRIALSGITEAVLGAYVGRDAGARILSGQIVRGEGHRVEAALMFADLVGFTAVADASREGLVGRLGEHLTAIVEPIEAVGGEVLKFMGDGLLAGFSIEEGADPGPACASLLAAAREALVRNAGVNAHHGHNTPLALDIALHRGEVFYGNVGGGSRLDFTVIGPAVNEASRIERLCTELGRPLLMSADFARCCGSEVSSLGEFELRGVSGKREIFTIDERGERR